MITINVAISGSKGFVGKNLHKFLKKNQIPVIPLSRKNFQKNKFPSLQKVTHFVHLAGIGSESINQKFENVNVGITENVINLCKKNKIKKIIYFSALGASKNSQSSYFLSKFSAEQLIVKSGIDYTIFRPSYIIGYDDYLTSNILKQIKKKRVYIPGSGNFLLQPITINNVCSCINLALTSKKFSKKIIDLVGPNKIFFKKLIKNSIKSNIKMKEVDLELAYNNALNKSNFDYGLEDLNILIGNYTGNFKKLQNLCDFSFEKINSLNT
tara:strand:+ start:11879 stop:12682 length:804 start_codon:yes stop_codon:yes gene_type:complete